MQLPPVHSISATEYFASGNVDIHATAVIAPGVILDAGENTQIVIGAGVCLGLGTIVIAQAGDVVIEDGVALGPGTLIIGPAIIAHDACVGSRSTIFQQDIEAQALIPAGHLLMTTIPAEPASAAPTPPPTPDPQPIDPIPSPWDTPEPMAIASPELASHAPSAPPSQEPIPNPPPSAPTDQTDPTEQSNPVDTVHQGEQPAPVTMPPNMPEVMQTRREETDIRQEPGEKAPVVGQVYINQLLLTLFPERKYFQS